MLDVAVSLGAPQLWDQPGLEARRTTGSLIYDRLSTSQPVARCWNPVGRATEPRSRVATLRRHRVTSLAVKIHSATLSGYIS